MSGSRSKANRKAQREPGEHYSKEPQRPTTAYLAKPERTRKRIAENAAERKRQKAFDRLGAALTKKREVE